MRTTSTVFLVSLALFGACARAPAPATSILSVDARPTIRFDNGERDYVHVYLVGASRQWLLGRVEAGAVATLRVPNEALAETEFVRLAVIRGQRLTLRAAGDPRARFTIAQPTTSILSQRWSLAQGELISVRR